MSTNAFIKRTINLEILKMSIITVIFITGGILFSIFIPREEELDWLHLFFYLLIGMLIIVYFLLSSITKIRRQKMAIEEFNQIEGLIQTTKDAPKKGNFLLI